MTQLKKPRIRLTGTEVVYERASLSTGLLHWKSHVYVDVNTAPVDIQQYCGNKDIAISDKYVPTFYVAKQHNVVLGIVSGHLTTPNMYRVKGLHVLNDNQVILDMLIEGISTIARAEGAKHLWALPDSDDEYNWFVSRNFEPTETHRDGRTYLIKVL